MKQESPQRIQNAIEKIKAKVKTIFSRIFTNQFVLSFYGYILKKRFAAQFKIDRWFKVGRIREHEMNNSAPES